METLDQDIDLMRNVFSVLKVHFPAWPQTFGTNDDITFAMAVWAKSLRRSGVMSQEHISRGLIAAESNRSPFFPSPADFISWSIPSAEELGIPDVEKAYMDACLGSEPKGIHPVVKAAKRAYGASVLFNGPADRHRQAFGKMYKDMVSDFVTNNHSNQELITNTRAKELIKTLRSKTK